LRVHSQGKGENGLLRRFAPGRNLVPGIDLKAAVLFTQWELLMENFDMLMSTIKRACFAVVGSACLIGSTTVADMMGEQL
jgi:hypothetical protein